MTTLSAYIIYEDHEHDSAVVAVTTSRTFYRVAITHDNVTVIAPGLERSISRDEEFEFHDLTYMGLALIAVISIEEEV